MPPITRELFISEDHVRRALTLPTMTSSSDNGKGIEQVPNPQSAKESGVLPEGYSVDFLFDPAMLVSGLKVQGITDVEQLPEELLKKLKEGINGIGNLGIVSTEIYDGKREIIEESIANPPDSDEEDLGVCEGQMQRAMRLIDRKELRRKKARTCLGAVIEKWGEIKACWG